MTQQRLRCRRPLVHLDGQCRVTANGATRGLDNPACVKLDYAAAWYSWMSPPSTSRRPTSLNDGGAEVTALSRCRHLESKAAVRPMLVVMPDVVAKDGVEMVTAENERPVEALFSYGPYPPLRDRVRAGRLGSVS